MKNISKIKNTAAGDPGIALLIVLWVLAILMVVVLSFSFMTRTETHATLSFKEGIEKKFIAEAGIERGIMEIFFANFFNANPNMIQEEGKEPWRTDGTGYSDKFGAGGYTVRITDESGKVDINMLNDASGIILKNLLMNVAGVNEETADTIVDSALDWKDKNVGTHRLNGAGDEYYESLPNPYKVKHADFDTPEELMLVKGVTPEILYGTRDKKGIIDFLTVYSRSGSINVNAAPKEVLMAIPGITPEIADQIISSREVKKITNPSEVGIPAQSFPFIYYGSSSTFTIESVGSTGDEKTGYAIKAVVGGIEGGSKYKYLYYKAPVNMAKQVKNNGDSQP